MRLLSWLLCCVEDEDSTTTTEFKRLKKYKNVKQKQSLKAEYSEQQTQSQSLYVSQNPLSNKAMATGNTKRRQPQPFVDDVQTLSASKKKFKKIGNKKRRKTREKKKDKKDRRDKTGDKEKRDRKRFGKSPEAESEEESEGNESGIKLKAGFEADSESEFRAKSNMTSEVISNDSESSESRKKKKRKKKKEKDVYAFDDGTRRERNEEISLDWENKIVLSHNTLTIKEYKVPKSLAMPLPDKNTSGLYGRQGLKFLNEKSFINGLLAQDAISKELYKRDRGGKEAEVKREDKSILGENKTMSGASQQVKLEGVKTIRSKLSAFKTENGTNVSYSVQSACSNNQSIAPSTRISIDCKYKELSDQSKQFFNQDLFSKLTAKIDQDTTKETPLRVKTSFVPKLIETKTTEASKSSEKRKEIAKILEPVDSHQKPPAQFLYPPQTPLTRPGVKDIKTVQRTSKSIVNMKTLSKVQAKKGRTGENKKKNEKYKKTSPAAKNLGKDSQIRSIKKKEKTKIEAEKSLPRQTNSPCMNAVELKVDTKQKPQVKEILGEKKLMKIQEESVKRKQFIVKSEVQRWEAKSKDGGMNAKVSSNLEERSFVPPTIQHSSTTYQTGNEMSYSVQSANSKSSSWTSSTRDGPASDYKKITNIPNRIATLELLKKLTRRNSSETTDNEILANKAAKSTENKGASRKLEPTPGKKPVVQQSPVHSDKGPSKSIVPSDKALKALVTKTTKKIKTKSPKPKAQSDKTDLKTKSPKKIDKETPKQKAKSDKTDLKAKPAEKMDSEIPKVRALSDKTKVNQQMTTERIKKGTPNTKQESLSKAEPDRKTQNAETSSFIRYLSTKFKQRVFDSKNVSNANSNAASNANASHITNPTVLVVVHTDDTGKAYEKVMSVDIPDSRTLESGGGIKIGSDSSSPTTKESPKKKAGR